MTRAIEPNLANPASPGAAARPGAPTNAPWDPRPGSLPRAVVGSFAAILWATLHLCWLLVQILLVPQHFAARREQKIRRWGRLLLALLGIRLEVSGEERLLDPGPCLLLFNHRSVIDIPVLAALFPARATILYKQEFSRIPIMGAVMRGAGLIPIDRRDRAAAVKSLAAAAERVRVDGMKVLVAPEGTRSPTDRLLPFKRGPFHLALQTRAPLAPFLIQGVGALMPKGAWLCRSGRVRVDVLAPIDTRDWTLDDLDRHMDETRALFLAHIPQPDDAQGTGESAAP